MSEDETKKAREELARARIRRTLADWGQHPDWSDKFIDAIAAAARDVAAVPDMVPVLNAVEFYLRNCDVESEGFRLWKKVCTALEKNSKAALASAPPAPKPEGLRERLETALHRHGGLTSLCLTAEGQRKIIDIILAEVK
jgi:hypothetical protein